MKIGYKHGSGCKMLRIEYNPLWLVTMLWLAGCSLGGSLPSQPVTKQDKVVLLSQDLLEYDQSKAKILYIGTLDVLNSNDLNTVEFHAQADCADTVLGQGLQKDFSTKGIVVELPSLTPLSLYVRTNTVATCFPFVDYQPTYGPPENPKSLSTQPVSPSRETANPLIFANLQPRYVSTIYFYDDEACTHQVGMGTGAALAVSGVQLTLTQSKVNKIYAVSEEPFGNRSACELVSQYEHTTDGPSNPVFSSVSPLSPNNLSTQPVIKGTVAATVSSITLFDDPNCGHSVGEGTAAKFASDGLTVSVSANSTNDIYAIAYDETHRPSLCTFMTRYIHDTIAPSTPQFGAASPASPTRLTTFPKISGTAPSDAATITFYSGVTCLKQIGSGSKADFEGAGININVGFNAVTSVYAKAVDLAGNGSTCVLLANYKHNTIPPDPPVFNTTNPVSPTNKSSTPVIYGNVSPTAVAVSFYSDENCTISIGTGTAQDFMNSGITINATPNSTTTVYGTAQDLEGNVSLCTTLTNYMHSTAAAPNPVFVSTNPASPSKVSAKPWVIGSAPLTVSSVFLYSDSSCNQMLGTANRATFVTSGIAVNLYKNQKSDIYAKSVDIYGNESSCILLTSYTHDDRIPFVPTYSSVNPVSPNNVSANPLVKGATTNDPLKVLPISQIAIYDSPLCLNRLGLGTPAEYSGLGILTTLSPNTINYVYAQTYDDAGNVSACTYLTTYMHSTLPPGKPQFGGVNPTTPSYTKEVLLMGTLGASSDFLAVAGVDVYTDSNCTQPLATGSLSDFMGTGISLVVVPNATTGLYAHSRDVVGNLSQCQFMVDYLHHDVAPSPFSGITNIDGSISLTWMPDMVASPTAAYRIKRALNSGGPYTLIHSGVLGNSYQDTNVAANTTYYYQVTATNITGRSQDSVEIAVTSTPQIAVTPTSLVAVPGPGEVDLTWVTYGANSTYRVFRALQPGGPYQVVSGILSSAHYLDTSVVNGTAYYYVVTGRNVGGESFQSVEASAVPLDVPSAPTGLTLTLVNESPYCAGGKGVQLSWSPSPYGIGYAIFRSYISNNESYFATTTGTTFTDCAPTGTVSGPSYNFYKVAAKWGTLFSDLSNEVATTNDMAPTLSVDAGNNEVRLYWSAPSYVSSYTVERASSYVGPFTVLQSGITSTGYMDYSVTNDTAYFYRVHAVYGNGSQGWYSQTLSAIPSATPSAPSNLTLVVVNKQPVLNWTAPSHYDGFNIYRASSAGGPYTYMGRVNTNTYTDTSPLSSMNYYYVTAVWGLSETAPTNTQSFRGGLVGSVAATASSSSISISWAALSGVSSYTLLRSMSSGSGYISVYTGTGLSYSDTSALSAQGYFYVVVGNFADGTTTQYSTEASGMRTGTTVPDGLTVVDTTSSSVQLAWAAVKNATMYKIYYATSSGGTYGNAMTVTNPSGNYTGLLRQTTYYFKVTSINSSGSESSKSSFVSATTYGVPSAPTLSAGNNSLDLQWTSVTGATSYTLERTQDGTNFTTVATGLPTITFTDNGVTNGQQYFYRVTAVFSGGETRISPLSAAATPGVIPQVPQGLSLDTNATGTDVTVSWSKVPGVTSYKIYLSSSSGGPWGTAAATVGGSYNNLVTGLTNGSIYYMVVTALRGSMESGYSSEIKFVAGVAPAAPSLLVTNGNTLNVSWSAVAGAATYDIERSLDRINFSAITSGLASTSYNDGSVTPGQSYVYRYRPRTAAGIEMALSLASIPGEVSTVPVTPQGFRGRVTGATTITLDWVTATGATSYNVYRGTNSLGPFSLVQTVNAPTTTFTDTGLVSGTEYFYYLRAVNNIGVESVPSPTISIALIAAPTGLVVNVVGATLGLSWNSVGGASGYVVRRSLSSGGPYGIISSGSLSTSYSDTDVENGVTYYYVVQSLTSTGGESEASIEVAATAVVKMNLESPIELTDAPLASKISDLTFARTQTSLNTDDYDGTVVTYSLEIHARNFDATARTVSLVDNADQIVGAINVPAATNLVTRLKVAISPTVGASVYRLRLEGTSSDGELEVIAARILVKQTNATKTKLYFPLLNAGSTASSEDLQAALATTANTAFAELANATLFTKRSQNLSIIKEANGWEFETLAAVSGSAEGGVALYNVTKGSEVANTHGVISAPTITLLRSPFNEGATGFSSTEEGNSFDVRVRCERYCTAGQVSIYKAGLWVTLRSLKKVEVFYRSSRLATVSLVNSTIDHERVYLDLLAFSNPVVYFQAVGYSPMGDSVTVDMLDVGILDSDSTPVTAVTGSDLPMSTSAKVSQRSSSLTLTSGHRYLPEVQISSGSFYLLDAGAVVRASP